MKHLIFIPLLAAGVCAGIGTLRAQDCASGYCPSSITVHHVAGDVSPQTITISYPVVETTLGASDGSLNCWIAQNLGATTQATSATDNTAAAAGWYWQFNREQGYAHDGTTSTPDIDWSESNDLDSDWETSKDPCLLLGGSWRMPTLQEWKNAYGVTYGGDWSDKDDAYASVLKLHAAGYISYNGTISSRSTTCVFHCGEYYSADRIYRLIISTAINTAGIIDSRYGISVRCLSEL